MIAVTKSSKQRLNKAMEDYQRAVDYFGETVRDEEATNATLSSKTISQKPPRVREYLRSTQKLVDNDKKTAAKITRIQNSYAERIKKVPAKQAMLQTDMESKITEEINQATQRVLDIIKTLKAAWS